MPEGFQTAVNEVLNGTVVYQMSRVHPTFTVYALLMIDPTLYIKIVFEDSSNGEGDKKKINPLTASSRLRCL